MTDRRPPHNPAQKARKTAKGRPLSASLAIVNSALSEVPLPKERRLPVAEADVRKKKTRTVSRRKEQLQRPSPPYFLSSLKIPPDPIPDSVVPKGEIDDNCYGSIVELFVKRYFLTFDKDRLALENAYISEATFSCRFIPNPRFLPPSYLAKCTTGTLQGSSSIIQALSSFSQRIVLSPPPGTTLDVTIDVLRLPDMNYFVTLAFNTTIEGDGVPVDMVFLLKDSTRLTGKQDRLRVLWAPFVVMSHQIIFRS